MGAFSVEHDSPDFPFCVFTLLQFKSPSQKKILKKSAPQKQHTHTRLTNRSRKHQPLEKTLSQGGDCHRAAQSETRIPASSFLVLVLLRATPPHQALSPSRCFRRGQRRLRLRWTSLLRLLDRCFGRVWRALRRDEAFLRRLDR